ncbi:ornithine--oxo-acid transaminase [Pseudemcibacter aquimaris]|uniref:ornithine--oxo-acid transaminase n=1 Tax=Pseudemcibacter aquimaris TaxID=2857064 RepID=UPI0020121C5D|nr:ornithine--oxo-acid transaminase [Pseudemcibacter aquimaris]MCC3860664.1 ornithine--oxo-acid transaminase [Pseudemcibacter aquimaris]WDU59484.1 ornithine--oxo-acid transaminase [Pseudemcibacter aquimaris]
MSLQDDIIKQTDERSAHNYHPLPLVLSKGEGIWVWDADGNKYLDCLSAYSAVNQGHCHPKIIKALTDQASRMTLTSRAFHNDQMGKFLEKLCQVTEMDMALPMNTGAESVETAIKAVRKWGYEVKEVEENKAEIICFRDNFHGRTMSTVSMSSEPDYRKNFGPFLPGFTLIDYNDIEALKNAITENTVAIIMEPIQGEAGIIVPDNGYLSEARKICTENNVLFVLDEIQTGLARTGKMFTYQHEKNAKPDMLIVGKALSGGVYPVSAIVSSKEIMNVFTPGIHGSTYGGNPLGAAVGLAALEVIEEEKLVERSAMLGDYFLKKLNSIQTNKIAEIRGKGLFIGIELHKSVGLARPYCEALMEKGMLCKETHDYVIRLAPPLIVEKADIDWMVEQIADVLKD